MKVTVESKFVKSGDVKDGDLLEFTNEGEQSDSPFKDKDGKVKQQFSIGVKLPNGDEKTMSLNNTSKQNMIDAYGDESKAWVGKAATVHIREEKVGNDFKDVIYLTHPNKDLKGQSLDL